jgi:hypothetical protein
MTKYWLAGIAAIALTANVAMAEEVHSTTTESTTAGAPMSEQHSVHTHKVVHHHHGLFHDKTKVTKTSVSHDSDSMGGSETVKHKSVTRTED